MDRIRYGDDPLQFGDLRLPQGTGPHPVAIVVHGGCWMAEYNLDHLANFSAALARAGMAVWTIEYRRVGNPGGGWPGTFEDVARAAEHVRVLARRFPLDLERLIAAGHSAGGHLVLWLAAQRRIPLRGVVSLAGITDLRRAAAEHVCGDAVAQLLGGATDLYKQTSPMELLPLRVPTRLVHGALDRIVPLDFSKNYEARARKAGDDARLIVLPGAGHFELIAPQSAAWKTVEEAVLSVLISPQ